MGRISRTLVSAILLGAFVWVGCSRKDAAPSPTLSPTGTATPTPVENPPPSQSAPLLVETSAPTPTLPPTPSPTSLPPIEPVYQGLDLDMLARLNQWRIDQGLAPFKRNETLDAMALAQTRYVASLGTLPDNFHVDGSGSGVYQRAAELGWPHYSSPQHIAVGEVAYVGANIAAAIDYWQMSQIHNATITNEGYREIGIGILPHVYGHSFFVVVGSRPNVLTALLDPASGQLYVTSERYRWSMGGNWIHDATQVQLLESASGALDASAWTPFASRLVARFDSTFYVALSDATNSVIVEVNPYRDIAWLPSNLASVGQPLPPAPTPVAGASIALIYDAVSLSVQNISGRPVDFSQIVIGAGASALPLTHWLSYFKSDPGVLSSFPAGECLQAYTMGIAYPSAPDACPIMRGVIQVQPSAAFWKESFSVYWQGQSAATCPGGEARCEVRLP